MHNDTLAYAETLEGALQKRYGEPTEAESRISRTSATGGVPSVAEDRQLMNRANEAFTAYLEQTGNGYFEAAAAELERLQEILNELTAGE